MQYRAGILQEVQGGTAVSGAVSCRDTAGGAGRCTILQGGAVSCRSAITDHWCTILNPNKTKVLVVSMSRTVNPQHGD